jgi:hypothetical protein
MRQRELAHFLFYEILHPTKLLFPVFKLGKCIWFRKPQIHTYKLSAGSCFDVIANWENERKMTTK